MKTLPYTVQAVPTRSGNGFREGQVYTFRHHTNGAYVAINDNGHERIECYPFSEHSAHLWDGRGVFERVAGCFIEVNRG